MRRLPVLLILLSLGPAVAAAPFLQPGYNAPGDGWTQPGGGPDHSGVAALSGPLDVLQRVQLLPDGFDALGDGPSMAHTPYGLTYLVWRALPQNAQVGGVVDAECAIARLAPGTDAPRVVGQPFECDYSFLASARPSMDFGLAGYDEVRDELLVCAGDREGRPLRFHAASDGALVATTGPADWDIATAGLWTCRGGALDAAGDRLCIPFDVEGVDNSIALIGLGAREPVWTGTFRAPTIGTIEGAEGADPILARLTPAGHIPLSCTATATGFVFVATHDTSTVPAFANFDLLGTRTSTWWSLDALAREDSDPDARDTNSWLSTRAAARGDFGAFVWHDRLIIADPSAGDVAFEFLPHENRYRSLLGPVAWSEDALVVPTDFSVFIRTQAGGLARWQEDRSYRVLEAVIAADATAWILQMRPEAGEGVTAFLSQIDLGQARTQHRLDLPLVTTGTGAYARDWSRFHMHAMPDGRLLVWMDEGTALLLGTASDRPALALSESYPAIGAPVDLTWRHDRDATWLNVGWGDGSVAGTAPDGTLGHRYAVAGDHTVTLTVHHDDGSTATSQAVIHVGQDPPQELNLLQRAFAPGNQDTTWGVIGLVLVLLGALAGLLARRRGRSRIAQGLRELDTIRKEGRHGPLAALRDLQRWHRRQDERLRRGRLSEDQFRVLEDRGASVLRRITRRAMEPFAAHLSATFARRLQVSLADGFVDEAEVADLRAALKAERLSPAQRKQVDEMLVAWA